MVASPKPRKKRKRRKQVKKQKPDGPRLISIAKMLQAWRREDNISVEVAASLLAMPVEDYRALESHRKHTYRHVTAAVKADIEAQIRDIREEPTERGDEQHLAREQSERERCCCSPDAGRQNRSDRETEKEGGHRLREIAPEADQQTI